VPTHQVLTSSYHSFFCYNYLHTPPILLKDNSALAYICFVGAAALALCYLLASDSLQIVGRLLSVSASALKAIPGLILLVALIKLVLMSISVLILAAGSLAAVNGQALANPLRGHSPGR